MQQLPRGKELFTLLSSDNAYACDPRIQRFREEEKEKKLAHKRARQEAARQKAEEEERVSASWKSVQYKILSILLDEF